MKSNAITALKLPLFHRIGEVHYLPKTFPSICSSDAGTKPVTEGAKGASCPGADVVYMHEDGDGYVSTRTILHHEGGQHVQRALFKHRP